MLSYFWKPVFSCLLTLYSLRPNIVYLFIAFKKDSQALLHAACQEDSSGQTDTAHALRGDQWLGYRDNRKQEIARMGVHTPQTAHVSPHGRCFDRACVWSVCVACVEGTPGWIKSALRSVVLVGPESFFLGELT